MSGVEFTSSGRESCQEPQLKAVSAAHTRPASYTPSALGMAIADGKHSLKKKGAEYAERRAVIQVIISQV